MSNSLWSRDAVQASHTNTFGNTTDSVRFAPNHLLNRQLQSVFVRIQQSILSEVLDKLQNILKSSNGRSHWMLAFITVIGLAMTNEMQQQKLYLAQNSISRAGGFNGVSANATAAKACLEIDYHTAFIFDLFRTKYGRRYNPLISDQEIQGSVGFDDQTSALFIRQLRHLIMDNGESVNDDIYQFLTQCSRIPSLQEKDRAQRYL